MTQVSEETHVGVDIHSVAEPEPVLFGRSQSRCKDVKAKKYLEPEPVKIGPAPQHWIINSTN